MMVDLERISELMIKAETKQLDNEEWLILRMYGDESGEVFYEIDDHCGHNAPERIVLFDFESAEDLQLLLEAYINNGLE